MGGSDRNPVIDTFPWPCYHTHAMASRGIEYIEKFFADEGLLTSALDGYEYREAQLLMARSILETFSDGGFYGCEAGTGIGKTIAYLLPAILWSIESKERVVVSTHTKNLQEQIFSKDLPLLASILPDPFRYELIKGKSNYLCLRRWDDYLFQPTFSLVPGEDRLLRELASWIEETGTGDLSHLSPLNPERHRELLKRLCCDDYFCSESACPDQGRCFLKQARRRAQSAHIVVVNHSLLIADRMADGGVLGDYDCLIIDECQSLPRVAREGMRVEVDRSGLLWRVRTLLRSMKGGQGKEKSPAAISKRARKAILDQCRRLEKDYDAFFSLPPFQAGIQEMDGPGPQERSRYRREDPRLKELGEVGIPLLREMESLQEIIREAMREAEGEGAGDGLSELCGHLEMFRESQEELASLLRAESDEQVYWIGRGEGGGEVGGSLNSAPIDVAPFLQEFLFSSLRAGVLTSATLRIMESFEHFYRSIGIDRLRDRLTASAVFPSPFAYEEQALVAVPTFIPDPREERFPEALVDILDRTISALERGTLVLFTSNGLLAHCYRHLKGPFEEKGIILLGQGIDGTRDQITRTFREERKSVLFGTDSFWEGVDVPGESLEVLVFTRLPFPVPADPLSEAVEESIRARGGNPFTEYYLPNAVMKFRQGFGRLIRSTRDRGIALVLDRRILNPRYGAAFVEALPVPPVVIDREGAWLPALQGWWSGGNVARDPVDVP